MFRHVALFKFKSHAPEFACGQLVADLAALPNQVPEIVNWSTGCNELNIDLAYDLSLIHICSCRRPTLCRSRWSPYH